MIIHLAGIASEFPLKNGKPTPKGIDRYVEVMGDSVIMEFQEFVGDTLYNVEIYTEEPEDYEEQMPVELGYYFPYEVAVLRGDFYEAYELEDLSPRRRRSFRECNRFVKAVILHELTHSYMYQTAIEMRSMDPLSVHPAYQTDIWILRSYETFGSTFIEEGVCEYLVGKMGELIPPRNPYTPQTTADLLAAENRYSIHYKYSAHVLKPFLDTLDFKKGIMILLHNAPPNQLEMMNPTLYFNRLVVPFQDVQQTGGHNSTPTGQWSDPATSFRIKEDFTEGNSALLARK